MLRISGLGPLALVLALSLASSGTVLAAEVTKIEVEFFDKDSSEATSHSTVWVSARRVRVEQRERPAGDSGPALIYRGDLGRFFSVDARARSYSVFEREQVAELGTEVKRARLAFDRHLSVLPGDQRRAMERLLGVTAQRPEDVRPPTTVTPGDVTEEVAGLECTRATVKRGGVLVGNLCIAPWEKLGITEADAEVFRELGNFKREMMDVRGLTPLELVPNQPLDLLVQFDGFPLSFRRIVAGGPYSAVAVKSVTTSPADDSLFEVPTDYAQSWGRRGFLGHLGLGVASQSPVSPATP